MAKSPWRAVNMPGAGRRHPEIAKRIDIAATRIWHAMTASQVSDLDLAGTPAGRPCEAIRRVDDLADLREGTPGTG